MRTPAFGVAVLAPLIWAGAVGASAPPPAAPVRASAVTPLAAVEIPPGDRSGASVVAVTKTPTPFHIATESSAAPPPAVVVNSPGSLRIPAVALSAYRNADRMMASAQPGCGISWNLLAGIGRIESMHANGGATDASGTAVRPIYGPALDGSLPGNEIIVQSAQAGGGRVNYARAMGPMQFLPGTWARYASDGDGDGKADPQNLYDSTLAAARYLCSGGLNLRDQSQVMTAILRYNNSMAYAYNVVGWAAAYATGVVPVDLPPLTGPAPPIGDAHLDHPEGLGPGLPVSVAGLPPGDPMALMGLLGTDQANRLAAANIPGSAPGQLGPLPGPPPAAPPPPPQPPPWTPPWMQPPPPPECAVFCLSDQTPAAPPPGAPPLPGAPPGLTPQPPGAPPGLTPQPPFGAPPADAPAPGPLQPLGPAPDPQAGQPAPGAAPGPVPGPAPEPAPGPALGPAPGPAPGPPA